MRKFPFLLIMSSLLMMNTGCDGPRADAENPLLGEWDTPYGMPPFGAIEPAHWQPALMYAMEVHAAEIDSIVNDPAEPGFGNVILALDNAGQLLERVRAAFSLLNGADTDPALQAVDKNITPLLSAHADAIVMNPALFDRVRAVWEARRESGMDSLQLRLTEKTYRDLVRAGAALDDDAKQRLRAVNQELAAAQVAFGRNLLAANKGFVMVVGEDSLAGLPQAARDQASQLARDRGHAGRYAFTLDAPSMLPFLTYANDRELRERLYRGYIERCAAGDSTDNRAMIDRIVELRMEKAQLLGHDTYASWALEDRMAANSANVYELLDELWAPSLAGAEKELERLREMKAAETGDGDFRSWDWWYWTEKLRLKEYNIDEEALRPYFPLGRVQSGIFELCNRLYGITFQPAAVAAYNSECVVYEVLDIDNTHLGLLLMDFHPREGKRGGAWCGSLRTRAFGNGAKTADPIVYIVCNFTRAAGGRPALLTIDETLTFFHEFGHALHTLFSQVSYRGLRATERDFVELPSQVMENWALEPAMLRRYALHYSSNAVIPESMIEQIAASRNFNQGFMMTEHLAAALSDMDIHDVDRWDHTPADEFERRVLNERRGLIPQIEPRYRYPYFNHIFNGGYAAGYYSYKWAEVLDKDVYEAFVESGDLFSRKVATALRREILSKGGTADGMTLFRNFRGREPQRSHLLWARGLKERPAEPEPIVPDIVDGEDGFPE